MELHDHLYALGLQVGREVFEDPEGFRGVLDDFLEEDEATTGDINLLVDAVRLGAYRSMITMLDSGADASSAVSEAGLRLARDRGSADAGSAQWACAVLGFAVGRVGEADVNRFRSDTAPPSLVKGPATELPPVPGPEATPPPPTQAFGAPTQSPAPTYPPPQPAHAAPQPGSYPVPRHQPDYQIQPQTQPQQPGYGQQSKKSRTGLVLGVVGTLAAVAIAIVLALVIAGSGDDEDPDIASSSTEPATEPTSDPTSDPPTSEPTEISSPAVDGKRVSDEAASGFTAALLTFSTDFGNASQALSEATSSSDLQAALEANADVRKSVYDFDLTTRDLDLDPVIDEVNAFLDVSAQMIDGLDETYENATTALDVALEYGELPLTDYTTAFQDLANAIDANRAATG